MKLLLTFIATIFVWTTAVHGADRALIIGVEKYADSENISKVLGAENDARAMSDLAERKLGFTPNSIHLLLNSNATSVNIRKEVRNWLIKDTKSGDKIFFFFAGHGTQIKDADGDEDDGFDEAIVPFDVLAAKPSQLILDDEINQWLKDLRGRRVVMIFDSCNSGTVTRSFDEQTKYSRFLPLPNLISPKRSLADTDNYSPVPPDGSKRDLNFVSENKVSDTANNAVVISAALPYQTAFGFPVNNTFRGALTYLLEQRLAAGDLPPLDNLETDLKSSMHNLMKQLAERGVNVVQAVKEQNRNEIYQTPAIEILSDCSRGDATFFALSDSATCKLNNPQSKIAVKFQMLNRKSIFFDRESFNFSVDLNQKVYLYVLVFSSENTATCVFPSSSDKENLLPAGKHIFPRTGAKPIKALPPWGRDVWIAFASKKPLNLGGENKQYTWDEVFAEIGVADFKDKVKKAYRGAGEESSDILLSPDEWQSSSLLLETRLKP